MAEATRNEYEPDEALCPGLTVQETLKEFGMTQSELAERTGRPLKTINEIVNGKAAITPETAIQFERVFGVPARFWNNLEQNYREFLARKEEAKRLAECVDQLVDLPVAAMRKLGWIEFGPDPAEQVRAVLNFFGVASLRPWKELCPPAAFRNAKAFESDPASVAAWLRKGEIESRGVQPEPYDAARLKAHLPALRKLTLIPDPDRFVPEMLRLCAECGVAVVFVPELPGTRLCGAARWLGSERALVQLSLSYETDDHLWFTFFHEIGHVALHGKRDFFVDVQGGEGDWKEIEADLFAGDLLLPPTGYRAFRSVGDFRVSAIRRYAGQIGVAPGIVVGKLQHDHVLVSDSTCNRLKAHYRFSAAAQ